MDNDKSTTNYNQQPTVPSGPAPAAKKRLKPWHLIVIIVVALGLIIGIGYAISRLLGGALPGGSAQAGGTPVTAVGNAAFINEGYANGARTLTVEGNANVVGLSKSGEQLAVWRDSQGDDSSELTIYSTDTLERTAGVETSGCTMWHEDDRVLCSVTGSDGKTESLRLYDMRDASVASAESVYEHPFANDRADLSSFADLEYLGRAGDRVMFVATVSNTYFGPNSMTEEEAAKATNFLGLYTVRNRLVVALNVSGGEAWNHEISSDDDCGLVAEGKSIACMDIVSGEKDSKTTIKTLDASTGKMTNEYSTSGRVTMASDGWIEDDSMADIANMDASTVMGELMKDAALTVYDLEGNVVRETNLASMTSMIGDMVPAPTWLSGTKITYTVDEIIKNSSSAAILSGDGRVAARSEVSQAGVMEILRASDGKRVASGTVEHISADGKVLFIINNDFDTSAGADMLAPGGSATLFNLETGEEIQALEGGNMLIAENVNGVIVSREFSGIDSLDNLSEKTIVYVPGR